MFFYRFLKFAQIICPFGGVAKQKHKARKIARIVSIFCVCFMQKFFFIFHGSLLVTSLAIGLNEVN